MAQQASSVATFVFTDLEGSTRLWEEHPDTMGAALAEHDAILSAAITAHGGTVVKSMGDGGYAVFASPEAAVAAAASVTREFATRTWPGTGPLRPRIGIHTGEAETRDGDYFGPTLNRASRLMSAAHGGQVVLSSRSADLVRGALADDLMLLDLGEHRFVGLARPEHVYQLAIAGSRRLFPPLASLGAFPGRLDLPLPAFARGEEQLSGRTAELDHLRGVARQAAMGGRRTVVIGGEPGIGKTRLAGELARGATAEHAVVLYGRSDEEPLCAYQPFVEALRPFIAASSAWMLRECLHGLEQDLARLFPELVGRMPPTNGPGPSDPETARYRLFEGFATLLCAIATGQFTILVLDDLHAADKPTLQLLRHVDRATADARAAHHRVLSRRATTGRSPTHRLSRRSAPRRRRRAHIAEGSQRGAEQPSHRRSARVGRIAGVDWRTPRRDRGQPVLSRGARAPCDRDECATGPPHP